MTEKKKRSAGLSDSFSALFDAATRFGSGLELRRYRGRAVLSCEGILAIQNLSEEYISLATHSGRIDVKGTGLVLVIFADRSVRIFGKVISVELGYGRY